jgi:hypothetical protein
MRENRLGAYAFLAGLIVLVGMGVVRWIAGTP